jgi:hypothetical protein
MKCLLIALAAAFRAPPYTHPRGPPVLNAAREDSEKRVADAVRRVATVGPETTDHYELNKELSQARVPDELLRVIEARAGEFNAVNAATALQRLATARLRRGERARGAAAAAAAAVAALERGDPSWADARCVASSNWALAKLGLSLPGALVRQIATIAPKMSGRELSTASWALATARSREATCGGAYDAASLLDTIHALERCADASARISSSLTGRDAATVLFALGTAKVPRPAALKALCRRLSDPLVAWNGQDVANSCWACASLNADAPRLFSAASAFVVQNASSLEPRGVATLAWSFAKERSYRTAAAARSADDAAALNALAARAAEVARLVDARSLALASWAFAVSVRNGIMDRETVDPCFRALECDAVQRLAATLDSRDLAGVAWALASAGRADRAAYEALARRAQSLPRRAWSGRALANYLWAFAVQTSGCAVVPLAQALEQSVVELAPALTVRDAAAICWSLNTISAGRGVSFDAAFHAVADASHSFVSTEGRALANLASSVVQSYADDSGGLDDGALDLRRILDAVALNAIPLAEGGALEPRALAALASSFAACRAAAPAPRLLAALAQAARDAAQSFRPTDLVTTADAFARCGASTPVIAAAVRALGADAADRAHAFPPRLRADLCRALAAVGATDSPFFACAAPRDLLLPPPETSYATNTTRVQILEVVPYASMFPGGEGE